MGEEHGEASGKGMRNGGHGVRKLVGVEQQGAEPASWWCLGQRLGPTAKWKERRPLSLQLGLSKDNARGGRRWGEKPSSGLRVQYSVCKVKK